jgi:hypothetical protein
MVVLQVRALDRPMGEAELSGREQRRRGRGLARSMRSAMVRPQRQALTTVDSYRQLDVVWSFDYWRNSDKQHFWPGTHTRDKAEPPAREVAVTRYLDRRIQGS